MDVNSLLLEINSCQKCKLSEQRKLAVPGSGNYQASMMIVGEAPGAEEDKSGQPFVGAAGKLLDKILFYAKIEKNDVFISNIVKCRPPNNRDPKEEETNACLPYLRKQYQYIQPKIVVCLGRIAAQTLIRPNFKITQEHGIWFCKKNCHFIATYHPSALLRDVSKKKVAWEDWKIIAKKYAQQKELT